VYTTDVEGSQIKEETIMKNINIKLAEIAKIGGIETLETRNSDRLDFHEVSVWAIKEMLQKAYELGKDSK
jgi:epoxyqueuosine reductase QueG